MGADMNATKSRKSADPVPLLCPSTLFRIARANTPILRQIVARCHVGDSPEEVGDYAVSRLNPASLDWQKDMVRRLARVLHRQNRRSYAAVMGGRLSDTMRRDDIRW
jgi:hypothetical protein